MLLCIQVVQIDNNESSWKKKRKQEFSSASKQKICELKICELVKKVLNFNLKNIYLTKYTKLIIKELKFNVNRRIKTGKNSNLIQI
jgi:uncharacterized tellurite resistance protein B-like protein